MRYIGVDPGGMRIGFAVGDDVTGIVTPLEIAAYRGVANAAAHVARLAHHHAATRVVIGLPTTVGGEPTAACRRSQALAEAVRELGLETALQPEHLTTNEARRRAREAGLPQSRPVDHIAAQVLLEEHLATRGSGQ